MQNTGVARALSNVQTVLFSKDGREAQTGYNEWSKTYDDDIDALDCLVMKESAKMFKKHASEATSIIDVAAGTGRVGWHLRNDVGYEGELDVLDANLAMLVKADQKDLNLRNILRHFIKEDGELPFKDEMYDVAICCGSFIPNHVPPIALKGMINVVKKGGLVIFTVLNKSKPLKTTSAQPKDESKDPAVYKDKFDDVLQEIIDAKLVEVIDSWDCIHFQNGPGQTTSTVCAAKKL